MFGVVALCDDPGGCGFTIFQSAGEVERLGIAVAGVSAGAGVFVRADDELLVGEVGVEVLVRDRHGDTEVTGAVGGSLTHVVGVEGQPDLAVADKADPAHRDLRVDVAVVWLQCQDRRRSTGTAVGLWLWVGLWSWVGLWMWVGSSCGLWVVVRVGLGVRVGLWVNLDPFPLSSRWVG
jgi:hypothetical protein